MSALTFITQVWRVKGHRDPSNVSGCQRRQEQGKSTQLWSASHALCTQQSCAVGNINSVLQVLKLRHKHTSQRELQLWDSNLASDSRAHA